MMSEKVCLIIGGGRGMGAATARQMHSRNYPEHSFLMVMVAGTIFWTY